ncbi:hypothetical protein ACKKBG_A34895 [Auxenochlorella protothecoides x Auxenochlorella symbiontica]
MVSQDLVLDRDVRDWVLIPLTVSVILMKLLQQYAVKLMAAPKPSEPPKPEDVQQKNTLARSGLLRANHGFISEAGFRQRRAYFSGKEGVLQQTFPAKGLNDMMGNPDAMQGMLKQQMGGLVPQMGMGAFVNYFFSGFILGRVPFSLSPKFRPMLQRGIDLPALDPSYFTSLSFYIMALFGLGGVFRLMFAEDAINDAAQMAQMQMGGMGGGGPPTLDPAKAYEAERQALDVVEYRSRLENSELRSLKLLRAQLAA